MCSSSRFDVERIHRGGVDGITRGASFSGVKDGRGGEENHADSWRFVRSTLVVEAKSAKRRWLTRRWWRRMVKRTGPWSLP